MATLHGVESGAILAVDGNPLVKNDVAMTEYRPDREIVRRAIDRMLDVALEVVAG